MQHTIALTELQEKYGPQAEGMIHAIDACVHCGFCLPTCPTYQVLGEEMDSPRGRIILMKNALEENLAISDTSPFIDRCLGCLACVTACPSGVQYSDLLFPFRSKSRQIAHNGFGQRAGRKLAELTLPYPKRFHAAARLGNMVKPVKNFLPSEIRSMLDLLPEELPPAFILPEFTPARGERRARVALLAGCAQQVLSPEINRITLEVLSFNGIEVLVPKDQVCCGAILHHSGDEEGARQMARQNLRVFNKVLSGDFDAVLTNAAGCGSGIKEYPHLLKGLPEEEMARSLAAKTLDVSLFLAKIGLISPNPLPRPLRVAYHDACHLSNAQGISKPPRQLLSSIPNLILLEIPNAELCCGSAGTYNIEQPEIANELGKRKAENILSTDCDLIAAGNIGCIVQIRQHLLKTGRPLPVVHTLEVLSIAYQG